VNRRERRRSHSPRILKGGSGGWAVLPEPRELTPEGAL
jgi:hypothetical protein